MLQRFNKIEFTQKVLKTGELLQTYLRTCLLASVEISKQAQQWIMALFDQLERLLKDSLLSPTLKIKLADFLIFLLLLGEPPIIRFIQVKVYPLIRNYAQYDRDLRIGKRGEQYFKNHPDYVKGNEQQKSEIRRIGIEYIHFFLQSVPVWASWIPQDVQDEKLPSLFQKSYQNLKQGGLQFPTAKQYLVYKQNSIDKKEAFVQVIIEQFFKQNGSAFTERTQKSNLESIGAIHSPKQSILMQQVVQKTQPIMTTPRPETGFYGHGRLPTFNPHNQTQQSLNSNAISNNQIQSNTNIQNNQPLMNQMMSQRIQFPQSPRNHPLTMPPPSTTSLPSDPLQNNIISTNSPINSSRVSLNKFPQSTQQNIVYSQNNLAQIDANKILQMQQKMKILQSRNLEEVNHLKMAVNQLQTEINFLRVQNSKLNQKAKQYQMRIKMLMDQLKMNQISMNQAVTNAINMKTPIIEQMNKLKSENAELKANLLDQCTQLMEFTNRTALTSTNNSRNTRQTRQQIETIFDPYFGRLSLEQQIRFKRTILKSKQILYKDSYIEIGCLSQLQDMNHIRLCIVYTSKSDLYIISNIRTNLSTPNGITLIEKSNSIKSLPSKSQQKQIYEFRIDEWFFDPIILQLSYNYRAGEQNNKQLLLPLTRFKFITSDNIVVPLKYKMQKSVLSSIQKLQEYTNQIFCLNKNVYEASVSCLGFQYRIRIQQFTGDCLKICLQYARANERNANILLQQLTFILSK